MSKPNASPQSKTAAKSGPGRPRKFTREQINAAALDLMEKEGFGSLSMRSLAQRLGASPASLYNYIGHIEDVENDALESMMSGLPLPSRERRESLRLQLIEHLIHVRSLQVLHPHFLHAPVGSATWRQQMRATARVLAALTPTPDKLVETAIAFNALVAVVGSTAERARSTGVAGFFEAERKALSALVGEDFELLQKPLRGTVRDPRLESLIGRLDHLINCLLPHLEPVTPRSLKKLETQLESILEGPWARKGSIKTSMSVSTKRKK